MSRPVGAELVEAHGGMGGTRALRQAQGERGWGMVLAIDQLATAPTSVRAELVEAHGGKGGARALRQAQGERGVGDGASYRPA